MTAFGRDRRRRLSTQEATELFARANGLCQRCGTPLGVDWHQAHLVAYTHGGATQVGAMEAWCRECNLANGSADTVPPGLAEPREWQRLALDVVLERIWQTGKSTLHAAPGAGKTIFAGLVFHRLRSAGLADRMVVVVPNRALQRQWSDALARLQIQLDWDPRDGFLEHTNTVGAVVTYQGLPTSAPGQIQRMRDSRTFLVLDEVHHVGENKSWGQAVGKIVSTPAAPEGVNPIAVLNMTGTLFRSTGAQKIATVHYDRVIVDGVEKFQAVADFSVPASALIGVELRRPDLYAYDGQVELVDVRSETTLAGEIADLVAGSQVSTAIREGFLRRALVHDFAKEALKLLSQQLATIQNREPLKMLWVAEDQKAARLAAEEIDKAAGRPFARLVISDNKNALDELRRAANSNESCAIVAVRMVTEGFDCPQVSVIAYASATTAVLFLAQTMARAMRVSGTERADQMLLPAQILIPNNQSLRTAFADALVGHFHILDVPSDEDAKTDRLTTSDEGAIRLPRYQLVDMSTLDLHSATVLGETDGVVMADELNDAIALCLELSIPEPYAPRVVVASRRMLRSAPLYVHKSTTSEGLKETPSDPRSINIARRKRIETLARWMHYHVEHDAHFESIAVFQGQANAAANIKAGGGRKNATPDQLELCETWMLARIREHCSRHGCATPSVAQETG